MHNKIHEAKNNFCIICNKTIIMKIKVNQLNKILNIHHCTKKNLKITKDLKQHHNIQANQLNLSTYLGGRFCHITLWMGKAAWRATLTFTLLESKTHSSAHDWFCFFIEKSRNDGYGRTKIKKMDGENGHVYQPVKRLKRDQEKESTWVSETYIAT